MKALSVQETRELIRLGAAERLKSLRREERTLQRLVGTVEERQAVSHDATPPARRRLSRAARKRISEAQKARWAKQKASNGKK